MRLSELKTGDKGVIVKVMGHGGFRKRIVEMGFIRGKTVEVLLNAPLKDPIKYRILGYEISLRREEANMIEVVSEEEARKVQPEYHGAKSELEPLTEERMIDLAKGQRRTINVALVGNPNCGKTSLFNVVSGAHERVGNYSGVTVDAKDGFFDFQGYHFNIVDLPGTYSLSAYTPEELYVRRHIIEQTPDIIINVVDSSNLERNLYLTTQLIDMNVRMVIALNMFDELEESGNKLDYTTLGSLLGVPMIPTVFRTEKGIEDLFHAVIEVYERGDYLDELNKKVDEEVLQEMKDWHEKYVSDHQFGRDSLEEQHPAHLYLRHIHINHGPELEQSIDAVKLEIQKDSNIRYKYSTRFLAIKLLENDKEIERFILGLSCGKQILEQRDKEAKRIQLVLNEDSEQAITNAKYGFINGALTETYTDYHLHKRKTTEIIDRIVTHKWLGYPIFFLFLYLMFECTFVIGQYPMDWIDAGVAALGDFINGHMTDGPLKDLLIDGIIGGVGSVIVFLPNILILYFFISIMEDSGYMARAAFIMDKFMHHMGLHGKSFIPLIMGFGCNVPAVMATRTIEDHKSRLITMLINPLMSCTARLPIYLVLVTAFFPHYGSLILLSIYTLGIFLAILMAKLFSKFVVKGDNAPFVMELPPYRLPTKKAILMHTWEKGKQYLQKMGGIILTASIVIWFLGYYPNHDAYDTTAEQQEHSYIGMIGKSIEPVFSPLGFDWKLDVGLLSGAGAKELVVSTLGVLYTNEETTESTASLNEKLSTHYTPLIAYSYMIFVLLYFPCIATLAAIRQESGSWKWALFAAFYSTLLAWCVAFVFYQVGLLLI